MRSGYNIFWSKNAKNEFSNTIEFLEEHWTDKELQSLAKSLDKILLLIAKNPFLFRTAYAENDIRRVTVKKYNTLYYRILDESTVEILSFFSNRKTLQKSNSNFFV